MSGEHATTTAANDQNAQGLRWINELLAQDPTAADHLVGVIRQQVPHAPAFVNTNQRATEGVRIDERASMKNIEDKHYRRMEKFAGAAGTWGEWSFNFVTTTEGINPRVGRVLEDIGKSSEPSVTMEALDRICSQQIRDRYGRELFVVLTGLTTGDAAMAVRGVIAKIGERCGLAAFLPLNSRFNAKTPAKMLQVLIAVVNPAPLKDVRMIPRGIENWELGRSKLESEFDERLSDKMAAAILVSMLPTNFQDMIFESQGTVDISYNTVRDKVLAVAGSRIQQSQPTPMDVSAVDKVKDEVWSLAGEEAVGEQSNLEIAAVKGCGKSIQCCRCGGYGHLFKNCATPENKGKSKGEGKGAPDAKGGKGGKGQYKDDRYCYKCGKQGHLAKDCWGTGLQDRKGKGRGVNEFG